MKNYTVVSGDTLSKIGARTGVAWRDIAKWNNIAYPYTIHVGQVLRLSGSVVTPTPVPTPSPTPTPSNGVFSTTKPMKDRLWGTYAETAGKGGTLWELSSLQDLETKLGFKFPIVSGFMDDSSPTGPVYDSMPIENMKKVALDGRINLLSFDLDYKFSEILSGRFDNKLKAFADACKSVKGLVYLRLYAEMNLKEAKWSVRSSSGLVSSFDEWIDAWKHIVNIFRNAGATNTKFIWCPNNGDGGSNNQLENYYPGNEWVDVLGFDGYCWSDEWETHTQVFTSIYNRLTKLNSDKPIWVGETGCAEGKSPSEKAAWVMNLLNETGFPRIEALCWFSVSKEKDWRMDSSTASTTAFKNGFAS